MTITGWILVIIGGLSLLGATWAAANNRPSSFGGLVFFVIGLYCLHVAKRRQKEKKEKEDFEKWSGDNNKKNSSL